MVSVEKSFKRTYCHNVGINISGNYHITDSRHKVLTVVALYNVDIVGTGLHNVSDLAVDLTGISVSDLHADKVLYKIGILIEFQVITVHIKKLVAEFIGFFRCVNAYVWEGDLTADDLWAIAHV